MFDQEEQKLLSQTLSKVRRNYKQNRNVYQVSAFDQKFDSELQKLVLFYQFDFQAIALHLYFKFPQYSHRLKHQAVSYRWYQLTMLKQGERIKQEINQDQEKRQLSNYKKIQEENEIDELGQDDIVICSLENKIQNYEAALKLAEQLDEQQAQGFMVYRPKFIIDTEFKLQREIALDVSQLSAFIQNQYHFQFGSFEVPMAAPLQLYQFDRKKSGAGPQFMEQINECSAPPIIEQVQEQTYMDDDWQEYQSD